MREASSNLKAHWLVKDDVITLLIGSSDTWIGGRGERGAKCEGVMEEETRGMERESN